MIPKTNIHKILVAFLAVMIAGLALASTASAECGPGFSNKQQLIHYYQNNPAAAHGFRKELLAHSAYTGYQADETVVNWLRSPEQKVFNAPSGYQLKTNTYCPGGPGQYQPYGGLLGNMGGKPMLWHCDKEGNNCVPILKGYCMNFVTGPPCRHHHPPKHHPHHPCGCRKRHHHKHHRPICKSGEVVNGLGCSPQTNNAQQECESRGGSWNSNQQLCTIIQINANCSNVTVVNGSGNTVNTYQEGNCNTTPPPPPPPPPCGCEEEPKPKPEPPVVEWERIQEIYTNHERNLCVTATPTSVVSGVQFAVVDGKRSNGGVGIYNASTNKYCVTYTAPSEEPSHECVEEWISAYLPPGTKCDVAHVAVFTNNGSETVKGQMEIPVLKEESQVVW